MTLKTASAFSQIIVASVASLSSSVPLGMVTPQAIIDALDNSVRAYLQEFGDELFKWIIWSAYLVATGCALEGPEILFEIWPKWFTFFTCGTKKRHEAFERRIKVIALIGWTFIVIGVAGEGIFEGLQNRAEGQLRTFNEIMLTDARLTAGAAKDSAESAAKAAKVAKSDSDDAIAKAKILGETVDKVAARAKNALRLAEEASSSPTEREIAMLEMKPVDFDSVHVEAANLIPIPGRFPNQKICIRVLRWGTDATNSASSTAEIIAEGLVPEGNDPRVPRWIMTCDDDAGRTTYWGKTVPVGIRTGVYVMADADPRTKAAGRALLKALKDSDVLPKYDDRSFELPRKFASAPPPDVIILVVGEHP